MCVGGGVSHVVHHWNPKLVAEDGALAPRHDKEMVLGFYGRYLNTQVKKGQQVEHSATLEDEDIGGGSLATTLPN